MPEDTSMYKNIKVLYAEDEEGIRENISFVLSLLFKEVFVAKDGEEAFELFEEKKPDLLIFDICMPKMDGIEVLNKIRKSNKAIPIIVLTAHTEETYLFRAIELNITRYLLKPFSKDALLDAIKTCILNLVKDQENAILGNGYVFDFINKNLLYEQNIINLSLHELKLLQVMSAQSQKIFSFEEFIEEIWGWEIVTKEALKSLVKTLRKKLPSPLIKNIFGIGYTLKKES
ncbi:MAG: response regulator transcription factor [Sulfurospirillaceae bacterium]|nr:response regulator transcription factor [Sulfurospirillaceae bacterium]